MGIQSAAIGTVVKTGAIMFCFKRFRLLRESVVIATSDRTAGQRRSARYRAGGFQKLPAGQFSNLAHQHLPFPPLSAF
jgi:hypothetical protein